MSSILTNTSAMTALQNLAMTQKNLTTTQSQISSGLRVASASDNAAYWSISTTMKSDTGALSAVTDALNLGSSVVTTATAALNSTITLLNKMKNDVLTAQTSGTDKTQVQTDISAQQVEPDQHHGICVVQRREPARRQHLERQRGLFILAQLFGRNDRSARSTINTVDHRV